MDEVKAMMLISVWAVIVHLGILVVENWKW
jgi:hypothetical protein